MLGAGLWTYDKFAASKDCPPHRWISAREAAQLSPALDTIGLRGAFVYHDGVTDDSRLVIEIIKKAATRGAVIANYAEVTAFGGKSSSVTDLIGGGDFQLRAKVFVSATGVWTKAPLRVSKGIHLVFAAEKFAFCKAATLIPALDGKRFHFVVPWHGKILVGTTDTDYQGDLDSPRAEKDEADNLLEAVTRNFPSANLSEQDVIASFAGLRPLVAQGNKPSEKLSRRERIVVDGSGMISVFGGKLTTYRAMAERVVDLAARRLGGATAPCCTHSISLRDDARETEVTRIAAQSADLRLQLVKGLPYTAAEVVYAARHEMAMTVEDVIERRTRIAMLARDGGNQCRALVKKVLESENAA
jgi:glycerol-3-phosphate dehydrogenase